MFVGCAQCARNHVQRFETNITKGTVWCLHFVNRERSIRKEDRSPRSSRSGCGGDSFPVSGPGRHAVLPDTSRIVGLFWHRGIETERVLPCWLQNTFVLITSSNYCIYILQLFLIFEKFMKNYNLYFISQRI